MLDVAYGRVPIVALVFYSVLSYFGNTASSAGCFREMPVDFAFPAVLWSLDPAGHDPVAMGPASLGDRGLASSVKSGC